MVVEKVEQALEGVWHFQEQEKPFALAAEERWTLSDGTVARDGAEIGTYAIVANDVVITLDRSDTAPAGPTDAIGAAADMLPIGPFVPTTHVTVVMAAADAVATTAEQPLVNAVSSLWFEGEDQPIELPATMRRDYGG